MKQRTGKSVTIYLPITLHKDLQRAAKRLKVTIASIAAAAISKELEALK